MIEMFNYAFMQNAFIAGAIISVICAVIGCFIVLRKMSFVGDGLAHISFGGVAIGMFLGIPPLISALFVSILSVFGIQKLREIRVYGDSALAIFFSLGLALGVVLVSLSNGFTVDLFSYLFGSILSVSSSDLITISILGAVVLLVLYLLYKELVCISFDENWAEASGMNVKLLNTVLMVLTAITVVISMEIAGILLVSSLMVIPASTALLFRKGFRQTVFLSIFIALLSVFAGLTASYYLDLAAGGAIVLTLVVIFFLKATISKLETLRKRN